MTAAAADNLHYRVARYYLHKLRTTEAIFQHGHRQSDYALAQFDREWPQIRHWLNWVTARTDTDGAAANLCMEYAPVDEEILSLRMAPRERLAWLTSGLGAATKAGEIQSMARHFYLIAQAHHDCGEFPLAEENAMQALVHAQTVSDLSTSAKASTLLGHIHRMYGNYAEARTYFEGGKQAFEQLGCRGDAGKALLGMGLVAWRMGRWQEARDLMAEALSIAREFGKEPDVCNALIDLSMPTWVLGDAHTAHELLDECIARCRAIGFDRGLAAALNTLGTHERGEGNLTRALELFKEATDSCVNSGIAWGLVGYMGNTADTLLQIGRYEEALEYAQQALTLARESGQSIEIAYRLITHVEIYARLGELSLARQALGEALEIVREADTPVLKIHLLMTAMELWDRLGLAHQAAGWAGMMLASPACASEEQAHIREVCAQMEAKLGPEVYARAFKRGESLEIDAVLSEVAREIGREEFRRLLAA